MRDAVTNPEIVMSVKNVSKNFALPHEKNISIKSGIINVFKKRDKSIEVQHALKDISFDIKKGEFFGILGRNGSGKSTMLKILAEIYKPTKGSVRTEGKLVPFIELGVGFNPELTGRENVYLNGALLGFSRKEIDVRYDDIVKFAELEDFMDQKLKNYSSGMQVRLAFSVATRAEAEILLIDEVLAVGDAAFQRKCYDFFRSLKKQNKTVVFVSHDMSAVREFCDRAVLIEASEIIAEGVADKIASQYTRLFIDISDDSDIPQTNERWGDRRMVFTDVSIVGKKYLDDASTSIRFTAEFKANRDIDTIVTGSSIMNSTGQEVCGTNTEHRRIKIENVKKGQKTIIHWEYPNIFTDGSYSINVSLHGSNSEAVADWWEGAASFKVRREEKSPFVVTPNIHLSVERDIATS
jgi:ABC-2 type transport system ATP-binding protein